MKGSDAKKGKHRKWLAGAAFSAALVGTCLLLFLLSDAGGVLLAALGVVQTVYEPAPVSTALPVYGDNVFEKCGINRDETGDDEKRRSLCGKTGIFSRDSSGPGP